MIKTIAIDELVTVTGGLYKDGGCTPGPDWPSTDPSFPGWPTRPHPGGTGPYNPLRPQRPGDLLSSGPLL
jgi:hypothetical protein